MADNYLEKRFAETFGPDARRTVVVRRNHPSLDTLLRENRSHRGFDPSADVTEAQLREIVRVNTLVASAGNRQVLRFKIVTEPGPLLPLLRFGAALPEDPGTRPTGLVVVGATVAENRLVDMDLGISLQSMALKAVSMGLNALVVCSFQADALQQALSFPYKPLAVLAVGKGTDRIFLKPVHTGEDLTYYRKDGIHYVPKLTLDDILEP